MKMIHIICFTTISLILANFVHGVTFSAYQTNSDCVSRNNGFAEQVNVLTTNNTCLYNAYFKNHVLISCSALTVTSPFVFSTYSTSTCTPSSLISTTNLSYSFICTPYSNSVFLFVDCSNGGGTVSLNFNSIVNNASPTGTVVGLSVTLLVLFFSCALVCYHGRVVVAKLALKHMSDVVVVAERELSAATRKMAQVVPMQEREQRTQQHHHQQHQHHHQQQHQHQHQNDQNNESNANTPHVSHTISYSKTLNMPIVTLAQFPLISWSSKSVCAFDIALHTLQGLLVAVAMCLNSFTGVYATSGSSLSTYGFFSLTSNQISSPYSCTGTTGDSKTTCDAVIFGGVVCFVFLFLSLLFTVITLVLIVRVCILSDDLVFYMSSTEYYLSLSSLCCTVIGLSGWGGIAHPSLIWIDYECDSEFLYVSWYLPICALGLGLFQKWMRYNVLLWIHDNHQIARDLENALL